MNKMVAGGLGLCFNTASGMDCMQFALVVIPAAIHWQFQYRKRYGLHAMNQDKAEEGGLEGFQYRKRYGLHAISTQRFRRALGAQVSIPQAVWIACNNATVVAVEARQRRFNTASGMDCMQLMQNRSSLSNPPCFNTASGMDCMQYFLSRWCPLTDTSSFNTASGMDCMQYENGKWIKGNDPCFNTASGMDCMQCCTGCDTPCLREFQYRKRYGLHAINIHLYAVLLILCFNTASGMDCMQ